MEAGYHQRSILPWRAKIPLGLAIVVSLLGLWILPARADYRFQTGDVLEISVFGAPMLHTKAAIDVDGNIAFPVIGQIKATGSSAEELIDQIAKLLAKGPSLSPSADPQNHFNDFAQNTSRVQITAKEVMISVIEYCPVYLNGAVVRPGPQPFRPGLTVRQALSLAGGTGISTGPGADAGDSRAHYSRLWLDYAREQARIWRLEAERKYLDERNDQSNQASTNTATQETSGSVSSLKLVLDKIPLSKDVLSQIIAGESDQLFLTKAEYAKEQDYLTAELAEVDKQLDALTKQQANEQHGSEQDAHEIDLVNSLYGAKLVTLDRVTALRHEALSTSVQQTQTGNLIAQTQRERETLGDQMRRLGGDRRVAIAKELEDANVDLARTRTDLQGLDATVSPVGEQGAAGANVQISVFRKSNSASKGLAATEDTTLLPGDVVQVGVSGSLPTQ
jgi:polysaccharide export outer membrane protein